MLKKALIKILAGERGLDWILCMRREFGENCCGKMKDVLSYLSLLAADMGLQKERPKGLEEFLVERNLVQEENPLVRLVRLIHRRRYMSRLTELNGDTGEMEEEDLR